MISLKQIPRAMIELARVAAALPGVEAGRRREGPKPLAARLRARGAKSRARDAEGRELLRRAIGWIDRKMPGGGNCYRRALLEMRLDRGAAAEPLRMGLKSAGGEVKGHAWLDDRHGESELGDANYDMEVKL